MSQPSAADQAAARLRLLGTPPRLPLSVALRVAWTSIKVRLSRSLVTVSSVVLAVAFLLTVLGENVVLRAVHESWSRDDAAPRRALALREAIERPRTPLALLDLIARRGDEALLWAAAVGAPAAEAGPAPAPAATVDRAVAADTIALARWIDELKPSQAYLLRRNTGVVEWLLTVDSPAAVDALIATAKEFKGVRLELPRERLLAVAAGMPALRAALAALTRAEEARLERVAAAGGSEAVLDLVRSGAEPARIAAAGLPLDQLLPELYAADATDEAGRETLRRQLRLDRARLRASEAVVRVNALDRSLLEAGDVQWTALADAIRAQPADAKGATPARQLAAAAGVPADALADRLAAGDVSALALLNQAIASPALWRKEAWTGIRLDAETDGLSKRPRLTDRQQTRLNRLLLQAAWPTAFAPAPAPRPVDLRQLADGSLDALPHAQQVRAALQQATGDVPLADLAGELAQRARLGELALTFLRLDYSPEKSGQRTFWLVVLSLLVCIVGIVNTMMMAVTERFREIATMKCLGAMDSFVLKSFMIESGLVGSVGAAIGAVIGALIVILQGSVRFGASFWSNLPAGGLAAAAGTALLCGLGLAIVGALLPALKAARMHPIEAMRIDA